MFQTEDHPKLSTTHQVAFVIPVSKKKAPKNFYPNSQTFISSSWKKSNGEDFVEKQRTANENLTEMDRELYSINSIIQMATHQGEWLG